MARKRKHSVISPSGSHRWLNCPGSAKREAKYPNKDSVYSLEGTDAHSLLEHCIKELRPASSYVGKELIREDGTFFIVDAEMAACVDLCYQWAMETVNSLDGAIITPETRYELPFIHKELAGTCDITIRQPFGKLIICDYKHGKGINVKVVNNSQLMIYALGALGELDKSGVERYEMIDIVIWQPRTNEEPKIWQVTPKELRLWGEKTLKPGAIKAAKGSKSLSPGDWCQFCKVKDNMQCPKLNQRAIDVFKNEEKTPEVTDLTPAMMGEIWPKLALFDMWKKALLDRMRGVMLDGGEIPGVKLVEGRSNRVWKDEKLAQETLGRLIPFDFNSLFTQKFSTVAQAEKILKKIKSDVALETFYAELVDKPQGKPTIAPADDKRPALDLKGLTDYFTNEENDNE